MMGPQRTGSSWLDKYFRERGDVALPKDVKEIFFFDRHFQRGANFYKSHFEIYEQHKAIAEVTTTAFDSVSAPESVQDLLGDDVTLVCILRHPVIRSYSLYRHFSRYGIVSGPLEQAAEQAPQILNSSRYAEHLQRWINIFGSGRIHILFYDDLEKDQDAFLKKLCSVCDLDFVAPSDELKEKYYNSTTNAPFPMIAKVAQKICSFLRGKRLFWVINLLRKLGLKSFIFGPENKTKTHADIPEADRKFLEKRLLPEIDKLEDLLGTSLDQWRK